MCVFSDCGWEEDVRPRDRKTGRELLVAVVSALCGAAALVVCVGIMTWSIFTGMDRQAQIDQAKSNGEVYGRIALMQHVSRELKNEGKTWDSFWRYASKPGGSGFDGVVLMSGLGR